MIILYLILLSLAAYYGWPDSTVVLCICGIVLNVIVAVLKSIKSFAERDVL